MVFLESVHRVRGSLPALADAFGADRAAFVGRELTKLYEQCARASLGELAGMLESGELPAKGEFVIVVAGAAETGETAGRISAREVLEELLPLLPGRQAVDVASRLSHARRNDVYREMLALKESDDG